MGFARSALVCVLLVGTAVQARTLSKDEKRRDFEQLASMIKTHYGPFEFKLARYKIDIDKLTEDYANRAEKVSNLEFYHLINRYVAEFHDSHFRSSAQIQHVSTLGFIADRIGKTVLLDVIDRAVLPEARFPFQRGDEIIDIGGKPAADVVADLAAYIPSGNPESALRLASVMIGFRPSMVVPPGHGVTKVSIRRGTSSIVETVVLPWLEAGDLEDEDAAPTWDIIPPDYAQLSIADIYAGLPKAEQAFRCSGLTRTAIPKGAVPVMTTPFVAYYHPTAKGNVGYLRIPHYSWEKGTEDLRYEQYEFAIEQLEKNTVGLIIDQDHNCGGSVFFLEKMIGLFADKPFQGLEFQFLGSRAEYLDFRTWVEGDAKRTLQGQDWLGVVDLVKKAWEGSDRLTAKTTFHNNRKLAPNAVRYTKPIVMLIDEMSGSGGDAFPVMMQGMGRAVLMGKRTMGAGGHVTPMPNLNNSASRVSITKSMFYRPDGVPVENNGAEPNIVYEPTRDDFMYGYREYQKRYLEELAKLLP